MQNQNRNHLLSLSDSDLLKLCRTDNFIATGKGGQKRNKTESAVRITLKDTSITATASDDRQQSINKKRALRRLRLAVAMELREDVETWQGQLDMNPKNQQYPQFIACLLDHLLAQQWQVSEAAKSFALSTGKLIKIIAKDDTLWQFINSQRQKAGYKPLKR
jgi:hypothetical protein